MRIEIEELAQRAGVVTPLTARHKCLGSDGWIVQKLLNDPVHREADLATGVL
jgi:hypothetical protein